MELLAQVTTASHGPRHQRFGQCEGASAELCQLRHWLSTNHTGGPLEAAKLCIDRLEPCNFSGAFRGINLWGWSSPQKVARRNPIWNTWTKKYPKKTELRTCSLRQSITGAAKESGMWTQCVNQRLADTPRGEFFDSVIGPSSQGIFA